MFKLGGSVGSLERKIFIQLKICPLSFDDYIYVASISISQYKDPLKSSLPVCKVRVTKVPLAATEMYSRVIFDSVCMTVFLVDAAV